MPITDMRMTRFWITLDEAVDLVVKAVVKQKVENYLYINAHHLK